MFHSFYISLQSIALASAPDLPPDAWWLPVLVLVLLGAGALIDALTAVIPDPLIFLGLLAVVVTQGVTMDWPFAAEHLRLAIGIGVVLWVVNGLWERQFKQDAFGMGDAKWTMLAVACFGFMPALLAWGCGACLSVLWIGGMRLARRKIVHVYFGPFLFIGLLAGLYWLRLR